MVAKVGFDLMNLPNAPTVAANWLAYGSGKKPSLIRYARSGAGAAAWRRGPGTRDAGPRRPRQRMLGGPGQANGN